MKKRKGFQYMNRKAFTLIEVLISVAILAVVATGLFQISFNSKNNFEFLEHKARFDRLSSIPIIHNDAKYHHKEKALYEFLRADYEIKEDEVRKFLKQKKVQYSQEEYARFSPMSEEETDSSPEMDLTLLFDKITISGKHQSTYVYKLKISQ